MTDVNLNSLRNQPDERGRFGMHGGRFVAETLMPVSYTHLRAHET